MIPADAAFEQVSLPAPDFNDRSGLSDAGKPVLIEALVAKLPLNLSINGCPSACLVG